MLFHSSHFHLKNIPLITCLLSPFAHKLLFPCRKMNSLTTSLSLLFLAATTLAASARHDSFGPFSFQSNTKLGDQNKENDGGDGFFGSGAGFGIPGFENGWGSGITGGGYGAGYGNPSGGHNRHGVIRPTVVCKEKGPCYMKKLTCPAKCFKSFSRSGRGYGSGGGGGGCTMDCKKKCVAYC